MLSVHLFVRPLADAKNPRVLSRYGQLWLIGRRWLWALLLVAGLVVQPAGRPVTRAQEGPLVLAFYYAWYDQKIWDSGQVGDQPAQRYASSDAATIARQVEQAQAAGIDAFVQSWYGPQTANNQTETNFRTLLDVAAQRGFRAAVDFETYGPFFPDLGSVIEALRTLLATHAQHPGYLRYAGKPVIFFWKQERFSVDTWAAVRAQLDPERASLWIAEGTDLSYLSVFDGHHLYNIAWSSDPTRTLADWASRVRRYESQNNVQRLWVATVMPGFDESRTGTASPIVRGRQDGAFYRQTWTAAMASRPDWIVITSFNEWVEGSMIEPSVSYGNLYLDLTREYVAQFKSSPLPDALPQARAPSATASPTPEDAVPGPTLAVASPTPNAPQVRTDQAVRVRAGPGTQYPRVGRLGPGESAAVVGRNEDSSWWQIRFEPAQGSLGWVSAEVVTFVGNATAVPVVSDRETPTPTSSATATPLPVTPTAAGAPPTSSPTLTRLAVTASAPVSAVPTPEATRASGAVVATRLSSDANLTLTGAPPTLAPTPLGTPAGVATSTRGQPVVSRLTETQTPTPAFSPLATLSPTPTWWPTLALDVGEGGQAAVYSPLATPANVSATAGQPAGPSPTPAPLPTPTWWPTLAFDDVASDEVAQFPVTDESASAGQPEPVTQPAILVPGSGVGGEPRRSEPAVATPGSRPSEGTQATVSALTTTPTRTSTPSRPTMARTLPGDTTFLLWLGVGALVAAVGLGGVLWWLLRSGRRRKQFPRAS